MNVIDEISERLGEIKATLEAVHSEQTRLRQQSDELIPMVALLPSQLKRLEILEKDVAEVKEWRQRLAGVWAAMCAVGALLGYFTGKIIEYVFGKN